MLSRTALCVLRRCCTPFRSALEPESVFALQGCGIQKPRPPTMMDDDTVHVEASQRLDPFHSGGKDSTTQAATDPDQAVSTSESVGLQLREATTPPSSSDEDGDSSSSGEEEEGSDMRTQVWECRMFA